MFVLFNKCLTNKKEIMKTTEQILTENGLDFEIQKVPLVGHLGDVNIVSPYFGLYNTKSQEIIHSVKGSYHPSQNREVVDMVLEGMKPFGSQLSVQRAGALNGGRKIFLQLAIEGDAHVGNDTIKRYVTIIDSNDGSTGLSVGIGDLTMSCQNQFYYFYKEGMKFRHTASIEEKIKGLPNLIEVALGESMRMIRTYEKLVKIQFGKHEIEKLANKLINEMVGLDRVASMDEIADLSSRKKNAMDDLRDMIRIETAQKGDNLWGLHSGVTRWTTHKKSAPRRENGRLESNMLGTNSRTNHKSLEFVLEHA
jgi:hypothetical protein